MTTTAAQGELWPLPQQARTIRHSTSFTSNMSLPVHRWFRYSAGFSADWASHTIREFEARRVLDPFVGSGTVLLAAQGEGADSAGVEAHPFVTKVAQAKLAWTADVAVFRRRAAEVLKAARHQEPIDALRDAPELLTKCFEPGVLADLFRLRKAVLEDEQHDLVSRLLWLALVAIIRPCSHVGTAQWQYVLPRKRKSRVAEPFSAWQQQVSLMASDMIAVQANVSGTAVTCLNQDIRQSTSLPARWADLVITSPPYSNNYDYADATRLEMTLLGEVRTWGDLNGLRASLIHSCSQQMAGVQVEPMLASEALAPIRDELTEVYERLAAIRNDRGGKKAYHSMVVAYFYDMASAWREIRRLTTADANACFVVGDSAPYGIHVPVERWLGDIAISVGFGSWSFDKVRDRNVKWDNRVHKVPLHEGRLWVMS